MDDRIYNPSPPADLSGYLQIENNLSDLDSVSDARNNLGLGSMALEDISILSDYYTESEVDTLLGSYIPTSDYADFVNVTGDTMTGELIVQNFITAYRSDSDAIIRAFDSTGEEYIQLYHTGTYGQLESSTSFIITAPNGATIVGVADPQLKIQFGDGNFTSGTLFHNDTDFIIGTEDFGANNTNLRLSPASGLTYVDGDLNVSGDILGLPPAIASKQVYKKAQWFFYDSLSTTWSDWYTNGTIGFDTSKFVEGTASLEITTDGTTALTGATRAISANWANKDFRLFVQSDSWEDVAEVMILVDTSSGFSSYYNLDIKPFISDAADNEWVEVVIPQSLFVANGTPDWSTVNRVIIRIIGFNSTSPTVWFNGFGVVDRASSGVVSIVFDDSFESAFTEGKKKMDEYGYKGTMYAIPDALGDSGYMTQAQTDIMHLSGWDIAGHHQTNLLSLNATQLDAALASVANYLRNRGYTGSEYFAYPNGGNDEEVRNAVQKYFSSGRTINGMLQPRNYISPMRMNAVTIGSATSTASIQARIDDAIDNNYHLQLVFHKIVTTPASDTEYSIANFATVIDYLNSEGVPVLPVSQALVV